MGSGSSAAYGVMPMLTPDQMARINSLSPQIQKNLRMLPPNQQLLALQQMGIVPNSSTTGSVPGSARPNKIAATYYTNHQGGRGEGLRYPNSYYSFSATGNPRATQQMPFYRTNGYIDPVNSEAGVPPARELDDSQKMDDVEKRDRSSRRGRRHRRRRRHHSSRRIPNRPAEDGDASVENPSKRKDRLDRRRRHRERKALRQHREQETEQHKGVLDPNSTGDGNGVVDATGTPQPMNFPMRPASAPGHPGLQNLALPYLGGPIAPNQFPGRPFPVVGPYPSNPASSGHLNPQAPPTKVLPDSSPHHGHRRRRRHRHAQKAPEVREPVVPAPPRPNASVSFIVQKPELETPSSAKNPPLPVGSSPNAPRHTTHPSPAKDNKPESLSSYSSTSSYSSSSEPKKKDDKKNTKPTRRESNSDKSSSMSNSYSEEKALSRRNSYFREQRPSRTLDSSNFFLLKSRETTGHDRSSRGNYPNTPVKKSSDDYRARHVLDKKYTSRPKEEPKSKGGIFSRFFKPKDKEDARKSARDKGDRSGRSEASARKRRDDDSFSVDDHHRAAHHSEYQRRSSRGQNDSLFAAGNYSSRRSGSKADFYPDRREKIDHRKDSVSMRSRRNSSDSSRTDSRAHRNRHIDLLNSPRRAPSRTTKVPSRPTEKPRGPKKEGIFAGLFKSKKKEPEIKKKGYREDNSRRESTKMSRNSQRDKYDSASRKDYSRYDNYSGRSRRRDS